MMIGDGVKISSMHGLTVWAGEEGLRIRDAGRQAGIQTGRQGMTGFISGIFAVRLGHDFNDVVIIPLYRTRMVGSVVEKGDLF